MDELDAFLDFTGIDFNEDMEDDDEFGQGIEIDEYDDERMILDSIEKEFEPIPYVHKEITKEIAVVDTETDPFAPNFLIRPFTIGFRTQNRYINFWGDDCCKQFFEYLLTLDEEYIIYAHNGGKFDFYFFLDWLDAQNSPLIINGRLVKIFFAGQEFRDSFAIIPESLEKAFRKTEIDYNKFTRENREHFKQEICSYLKDDCDDLYTLVTRFHQRFGDSLTIASCSLRMLQSFHGFQSIKSENIDSRFRQYYYGGRNQCFKTGIIRPNPNNQWMIVDRNSMYPSVMMDEMHPISASFELQEKLTDDTDFACIVAENRGALPIRKPHGELDFTSKFGEYYATIHEIRAGLETGTLKIDHVKHAWKFERKGNFKEFIQSRYEMRLQEKATGDYIGEKNTKREMNSSYGKFALNPRKFKQYKLTRAEIPNPQPPEKNAWTLIASYGDIFIWERPTPVTRGFQNVATAASITGAARANLLRNIALSSRPIYCDTDSIICENFRGNISDTGLGGWKIEAFGDTAAIAGKKLYAVFNQGEVIKKASKGANINAQDIMDLCKGKEIIYEQPAPAFKLDGNHQFITRKIRRTG